MNGKEDHRIYKYAKYKLKRVNFGSQTSGTLAFGSHGELSRLMLSKVLAQC